MTYGENGNRLRAELASLLRQHRIQHRLGGPGSYTVPESTTAEQREVLGEQIQRYRQATLTWCLQAVAAANPRINLEPTAQRSGGPAEELRYRLTRSIEASNAGLPMLDELTTRQDFPMVESWRQVAKAAAMGEHDLGGPLNYGRLSAQECNTVLSDAAEVTRALVVLDKRYCNIPGWQEMRGRGRLDLAARACSLFVGSAEQDHTVDLRGWRAPSALVQGGPLPGIGGVLQAEHNMLVHLARFPTALNLRRVMDGQRILSHEGARRAPHVAPDLIEKWLEREQTYTALINECHDIGGLVGGGGPAAAEAATAASRLRHLHVNEITSAEQMRELDKLFTRTDARLATIIEHGVAERLYFLSIKVPRIIDTTDYLVSPVRERYVPITTRIQTDLIEVARLRLRPAALPAPQDSEADHGRQKLREALVHAPSPRRGPSR